LTAPRLFVAAVITYGMAVLVTWFWPKLQDSLLGMIVIIPPFSVYVFEHFGVPGLTDPRNCDWMWCKPTIFGIVFTAAVWLGAAWLVSSGIARLLRRGQRSVISPGPWSGVP
jgi:hypothetical protein